LERVTGCNGLCDFDKFNTCNCGCGRWIVVAVVKLQMNILNLI
jgi:hypothetical protein